MNAEESQLFVNVFASSLYFIFFFCVCCVDKMSGILFQLHEQQNIRHEMRKKKGQSIAT